jgi:hypothetical protein
LRDRSGNISTRDQKVIVTDIEPPVVTNIQNLNFVTAPGNNSVIINLSNPTTTDNDAVVSVSNDASFKFPDRNNYCEMDSERQKWKHNDRKSVDNSYR